MMNLKTTKVWPNYVILLLVIAFLAAQFITVHIHLAEQHHHDGTSHQHRSDVHIHEFVLQAIDRAHQENRAHTIEFDSSFSLQKKDKQNPAPSAITLTSMFQLPTVFFRAAITSSLVTNTHLSYLSFSTTHPRAPPIA
jgi:hypothetical protein